MFKHMKITQIASAIKTVILIFLMIGVFLMCQSPIFIPEGAFQEFPVDMSGSWKITSAYRNGMEISEKFDFNSFGLKLNFNNSEKTTYQISTNKVPFPVISDGNWEYDDLYILLECFFFNSFDTSFIEFAEAPITGFDKMQIKFQLGCSDNVYIYNLELQ